jgi:predicted TIM-barrel fold metal-dependent hydrolase
MGRGSAKEIAMKMEDMVLVSLDDHVIEPPNMYDQHLTIEQKQFAPTFNTDANGYDYWMYNGKRMGNLGLNAVVGRPKEEYGIEPLSLNDMRRGCYDVRARVDDMNVNGVLASLCYPTIVRFDGRVFLEYENKAQALTLLRAYNDWFIDEWCGSHPGRFIPLALMPTWDIDAAVKEIARVAAKGCHAVNLSDNPANLGLPSIHSEYWDPFWKACADHDMVIAMHHGTGNAATHSSMDSPIDAWITCMPMSMNTALADCLHLKALQKYRNMKIALIESGIGWIPFVLERADFVYQQHGKWTHSEFGGRLPSQVFRDQFLCTFIVDQAGLGLVDELGVQTICYEVDYPHSDTQWPRSPEVLFESLTKAKLTDDQMDLITHKNSMNAFKFDPFSVLGGRQNCTVGALRAQAIAAKVETCEIPRGGLPVLAPGEVARRVTSADVLKQMDRWNVNLPAQAAAE